MNARSSPIASRQAGDWRIASRPALWVMMSTVRVLIRSEWVKPSTWEMDRGMSMG